jgi:hypothetical protein
MLLFYTAIKTMATLAKADVLASWNFKHIVNLDRIRGCNGINYQLGHNMIEIRTPKEIISYDDTTFWRYFGVIIQL